MSRLTGRVALVTGGASGIGAATCRRLAAEGAQVVVADVAADAGQSVADDLDGWFVAADVASAGDTVRMYAETVRGYGRVDVAVHSAGFCPPDDGRSSTSVFRPGAGSRR